MNRPHLFRARPALALLLLAALAGCAGPSGPPTLQQRLFEAGRAALAERRAARGPERPALTRAALEPLEGAFLEAVLERDGRLAYLYVSARRRDDGPGTVTIWRTEDDVTLSLRGGVLIATRGLGGDLLAARAPLRGDAPGPAGGGARILLIRGRDNKALRLALACELEDLGPRVVEIVERSYATRYLRERCTGGGGEIVNEYWIDSAAGLVRQSRQWAGPRIGYLRLRRLTD